MTTTPFRALLGLLLLLAAAPIATPQDSQIWTDLVVKAAVSPRWGGVFDGQLRFGDGGTLVWQSGQAGLEFKPAGRMLLSGSYEYIHQEPAPGKNTYESRARIVVAGSVSRGGFHVSAQNLFEYRFPNGASSYWEDRPALAVVRAVGPERWALMPYLSDEVFYDSSVNAWNRNRFFVGIRKGLGRGRRLEVYYCREDNRSPSKDLNMVGVALRLWFGAYPTPEQPEHPIG